MDKEISIVDMTLVFKNFSDNQAYKNPDKIEETPCR